MSQLKLARSRPGPPLPDSSSSFEVITGEGQDVSILFWSQDEAIAQAFEEGYNLGILISLRS